MCVRYKLHSLLKWVSFLFNKFRWSHYEENYVLFRLHYTAHTYTHIRLKTGTYTHTHTYYIVRLKYVCDDRGLSLENSISKGPQCLLESEHVLDYESKLLWQQRSENAHYPNSPFETHEWKPPSTECVSYENLDTPQSLVPRIWQEG